MNELLVRAVDSLAAGAACALVAGGIALALSVRRPINLSMLVAPGAAMLIGGSISGICTSPPGWGIILLAVLGSIACCCGIWWIIDQGVDRPMRKAAAPAPLLTAAAVLLIGLIVIERAARLWPMDLSDLASRRAAPATGSLDVPLVGPLHQVTWLIAAATLGGLVLVLTRTRFGLAMRAVGYRPQTAGLLGINVERMIAVAVVIAAALAALGGLLYGMHQGALNGLVLLRPGLISAAAVVAAGPHRPWAVVATALGLGTIESYAAMALPAGAAMRDAILVIIAVVAVLARPADRCGDGVATT